MIIYINSVSKDLPGEIDTVGKLLDFLRIPSQGTGVGLNNHLVPSRNWNTTHISQGDHITIISATYGG